MNTRELIIKEMLHNKWNITMLRMCTRELIEDRKLFKKYRNIACLSGNVTLEIKKMEELLINKANTLDDTKWNEFYEKLLKFEAKKRFHYSKKIFKNNFV